VVSATDVVPAIPVVASRARVLARTDGSRPHLAAEAISFKRYGPPAYTSGA
jgi:hypothetical protein